LDEPITLFDDRAVNPADGIVMAFVVANPNDPCDPSWGARHPLDLAETELDLDGRIERYRASGGDVVVSFGGAINDELAVVCTDPDQLLAAYLEVVERYQPVALDFDIEGEALFDSETNSRRNLVIARLQQQTELPVWLTVPVFPDGLPDEGLVLIEDALAAGIDISKQNIMTMNFGTGSTETIDLVTEATRASHTQLADLHRSLGMGLSDEVLWARMSATVMAGQNDVRPDQFSVEAAEQMVVFADGVGLGHISMWSLARDQECDRPGPILSGFCSGVEQDPAQFGLTLGQHAGVSAAPWMLVRDISAARVDLTPESLAALDEVSVGARSVLGLTPLPQLPQ